MDFYKIVERNRKGEIEIYPDFRVAKMEDLLVKGRDFYAVWLEDQGLWSTDILDVQRIVDKDLWDHAEQLRKVRNYDGYINVKTLESDASGSWARFVQFLKRYPDTDVRLDEKITFANTKVKKKDYISKRLSYSLEKGDYSSWDKLVSTLYEPKEREKIEWMIGAIISGDSKNIQKFFVFYGEAGSGKSTIINVIQKLFDGYYTTFDAQALGSANSQFATEAFRTNPLLAIQHDGDLSRIEDNTRLNSIVSHETMTIKEKFKSEYTLRLNCFLVMGTNKPVKITDSKSGLLRRLIDIHPTGKRLPIKVYDSLMSRIDFELGAIAEHCLEVYRSLGKNYYNAYSPKIMIEKTNLFYNFIWERLSDAMDEQPKGISLQQAYSMYKEYCSQSNIDHPMLRPYFREELKNYFTTFSDQTRIDGERVRSWYSGFRREKIEAPVLRKEEHSFPLVLDNEKSLLDDMLADCPAQYGVPDEGGNEKPESAWDFVTTKLKDLDTSRVHYVLIGNRQHIVIDFDLKNENGEKDIMKNLEAASRFPSTYAEFSKGGCGIHLHYIYDGDVDKLALEYSPGIEIKVFRGKSALRRRVSKCNDIPVATLRGGLPLREEKMIDVKKLKDEKHLINVIKKCLRKENHGYTRPEIDLIAMVLEEAYASGMEYDVRKLEHDIYMFALGSSHQSDYCIRKFKEMKLCSKSIEDAEAAEARLISSADESQKPIIFFDCEVFPNLFLVNWKEEGEGKPVVRMVNPSPADIEELLGKKLVGFNCRKYDNHMLYARYIGYTTEQLFDLSQRIIVEGAKEAFFPEAYNVSYTDIYDFSSKKQSLKKWEIELGIHHQELGLPWDKPVPEAQWKQVAEYCDNDVIATEAVWNARQADFTARRILADIAGGRVNDTTNQLSTRFIFGDNRNPQGEFEYRFMGDVSKAVPRNLDIPGLDHEYTLFDTNGRPLFSGYVFDERKASDKSTYRGESVGEGGYVYAEPGMHYDVALLDIASMHPSSIVAENLFGDRYTARFKEILDARVAIKHKEFDRARKMLGGKLEKYLTDESVAKDLAGALKIVINSVYGLTSARFTNAFRDPRNKDNIVAKRGALFMINLKHEVQKRGFTVAHIKTDSIKIPNATPEIIQFVMDYGKLYGYTFEHEATYDRMCLVNDAVYIARYDNGEWTATGAEFQHPYIFKTLFSGEPIEFSDYCETKSVTGDGIYLDMNEELPDVSDGEEERDRRTYNASHPQKPKKLNARFSEYDDEALDNYISKGHAYSFIGRAGLFFPVRKGSGGGRMVRLKDGKFFSVTGTKDYRWFEAEVVREMHMENCRDIEYYDNLIRDAIASIEVYGSYEQFSGLRPADIYEPPFDEGVPCGDGKHTSCAECPSCDGNKCAAGYSPSVKEVNGHEVA